MAIHALWLSKRPCYVYSLVMNLFANMEHFCAAYLDDILLFSNTWEEHKRHVTEVLKRIKAAGLTLNTQKLVFAVAELDFLCFHIGRGVVQPREKKIAALLNFDRPCNRKQMGLSGIIAVFCLISPILQQCYRIC